MLSIASSHDWSLYFRPGFGKQNKYLFRSAKRSVGKAKLGVGKTFELASYYAFFRDFKYAYKLTKKVIDDTENPQDLIFFLKLIHHTNVGINRKKYLKYFNKIRQYSGKEYCTFFNSPALNFQIFDDEEIKEIYCKECGDLPLKNQ